MVGADAEARSVAGDAIHHRVTYIVSLLREADKKANNM